jgi:multiple sugar transport system ATP-binding protein
MANILLKNLYKKFKNSPPVINDFNLEVDDSDLVVLLGPSGAGKTTLLRLISGLEELSSGEIYIGNTLMNDTLPKDRNIGMVFQNQSYYPHLSVLQNLSLSLESSKLSKAEIKQKVIKISQELDIQSLLHKSPRNLSDGQLQRLSLARAIIRSPKTFLLDEPLANLDFSLRIKAREQIVKVQKEFQTSMIYATHNEQDAMSIASKIVVMKDGFIQQVDTPIDLYNHPQNLFVAKFIGYPKMNLIHGELKQMGDQVGISFQKNFITLDHARVKSLLNFSKPSKKIVLGIRPEHIKIINVEHAELNGVFRSVVTGLERLGSETYVTVEAAGVSLTLKAPGSSPIAINDRINIGLFMKKSHIFDSETDSVITH